MFSRKSQSRQPFAHKDTLDGKDGGSDSGHVTAEAAAGVSDEALIAKRRVVAEQRKAAEALLREVSALDERLQAEAVLAEAVREHSIAQKKADTTVLLERQAKEAAQAASELHASSARDRKDVDEAVVAMRPAAEIAAGRVAQIEQQVRDAQRSAAEIVATLDQHTARATECAAIESAAASEQAEAAKLVAECETARTVAEKDARAARERAEALKKEILEATQTFADDVEGLATRIAQSAASLRPASSAGAGSGDVVQVDFSQSKSIVSMAQSGDTLSERARRAYPMHPNRQAAFLAGWKACAELTTSDEAIAQILEEYTTRVYGLQQFQPNELAIELMRKALKTAQSA